MTGNWFQIFHGTASTHAFSNWRCASCDASQLLSANKHRRKEDGMLLLWPGGQIATQCSQLEFHNAKFDPQGVQRGGGLKTEL